MKTKIASALLTIATTFGFAIEPSVNSISKPLSQNIGPKVSLEEKLPPTKSFLYLRMGVSGKDVQAVDLDVIPGIGLGYRLTSGSSAFDLSASFNRRKIRTEDVKDSAYFYTLPKVNYLYYVSPASNTSFYAGGGLAWGKIEVNDDQRFLGLIPNAAVGLEMNRNAAWRSFIQVDISQPAFAAEIRGDVAKPFAEVTLGAGF